MTYLDLPVIPVETVREVLRNALIEKPKDLRIIAKELNIEL